MKMRNKKSIYCILITALCVTLGSGYVRAEDTSETKAQGIHVAYHTQDEIKKFCAENIAGVDDALTYSDKPVVDGNYSAGKLSDETINSAINMINRVRYIAGISYDVQPYEEYNSAVQAATLVNYVNRELSHYPEKPADMDEDLYELGEYGACRSNIAWASWENNSLNWSIINGWLEDGDASNIDRLGHRRWVLNPSMKYTGFGAVTGTAGTYSAMYAFDMQNTAADEYGVAWPAQNMPVEYFGTIFPWSVSMGESVDIESVKVKLTRKNDSKVWNFSNEAADGYFNVNNGGYGQQGCIIFRPNLDKKYTAGDVYDVEITGLGDGKDVSYTVNFFQLEGQDEPITTPTAAPEATPTVTPTAMPEETPTDMPTATPTVTPTATSTVTPTAGPTTLPTVTPTQTPVASQPATGGSELPEKKLPNNKQEIPKKVGTKLEANGNRYKVTQSKTNKATVEFIGCTDKKQKEVSIPKTITVKGVCYTVTSIGAKAFSNMKALNAVQIENSVSKIGKNAFVGCKKLKKITIKSKKLTSKSVAKKAFSGIGKKTVIKVPKSRFKAYKKLFRAKGLNKKVKIRKM